MPLTHGGLHHVVHCHGREKSSVQNSTLSLETTSQKECTSLLLTCLCPKQVMWLNLISREKGSVPRRPKILIGGQHEILLGKCKVLAQSVAHEKL